MSVLVAHEAGVRFGVFGLVLVLMAFAERRWPARADAVPAPRQLVNAGLAVIDAAVLRVAFPILAVGYAVVVAARGGGFFGAVAWPRWVECLLALLAFDAAIYWQHRVFHRVPVLWRLHRVHHTDLRFDVTTGVRFHPGEIALSMGVKLGLVAVLGPDPAAVALFEIVLSTGSLVTHTDVALPPSVESVVRMVVVTPSMHRIHHSVRPEETDSNFGFNLSVWDRVFASYRPRSAAPERRMPLGLAPWRDPAALGLGALLVQPLGGAPPVAPGRTPGDGDA